MSWLDRYDGWAALILALGAFLLLFATEGTVAVGWDEPITTENGQRIVMWLGTFVSGLARADLSQVLDPVAIGWSFGLNNEHPPVAKAISGLGWALTRRWLPLPTAHRVGPMALAAALVALIYVAVRQTRAGRPGALVGALALLDMPRVFFYAHVAALDLPAAAMWFFAVWIFWRLASKARSLSWRSCQGQPRSDSKVASDGTPFHSVPDYEPSTVLKAAPHVIPSESASEESRCTSAGGACPFGRLRASSGRQARDSSSQKTLLRMTFSLVAASLATRIATLWLWIVPGLAFGLALATKISNVLAPIGVGLWLLTARERRWRWDLWGRLILAGPLGLLTVITLFPWLWSDTVARLEGWIRFFTVSHYEIYQYYLGKTYLELPWHFPIVTVLTTMPVSLLILAGIGAARALRPGPTQSAAALWLINALLMVIWFMRPASRAFDRLLMPTYVFLAPLAGLGFDVIAGWIRQKSEAHLTYHVSRFTPFISPILAIIVLAPGALAIARLHPFELAYYNEAIGGVHGAQRLRLETIYWASTYRAVLPELNQRAKPGATVWVMPNSWDVLYYYQKAALLRDDLVMVRPPGWGSFYDDSGVKWVEAGMDQADFAIVEYRQTTFFDYVVDYMAKYQPVWRLDYRDIPLVALYERSG